MSIYLRGSRRPVFEPPGIVINPKLAIDYWLACPVPFLICWVT